nr:MAG TPA: hypothetical protein [Caudoviricetes sp.]
MNMHNAFELRVWYKSKSDMMYDNNADGFLLIGIC